MGHAKDFVEAQRYVAIKNPRGFVIATGTQYSERDFNNEASKNQMKRTER